MDSLDTAPRRPGKRWWDGGYLERLDDRHPPALEKVLRGYPVAQSPDADGVEKVEARAEFTGCLSL